MNQRLKDVYIIPSVITLTGGLLLIPVGAWLTNVPIRTVITVAGIKNLWFAPVSAWVVLIVVVAASYLGYLYWRSRAALTAERAKSEAVRTQPKQQGPKPKLHWKRSAKKAWPASLRLIGS